MAALCPNCGARIGSRLSRCPSCHGPLTPRRRDPAPRVFAWTFAAFNALMVVWTAFYLVTGRVALRDPSIADPAEGGATAMPLGGGLGLGFLLTLWLLGLIILGLCAVFNIAHRPDRPSRPWLGHR